MSKDGDLSQLDTQGYQAQGVASWAELTLTDSNRIPATGLERGSLPTLRRGRDGSRRSPIVTPLADKHQGERNKDADRGDDLGDAELSEEAKSQLWAHA